MPEQPLWQRYQSRLDALAELPLNFDLERSHEYTRANGWRIDDYQADLPPEPPGPPLPNGSWEAAREVLRNYQFADPKIITGIFYPDRPLKERVMLMRGRAFGMSFWFGVRIGGVIDEVVADDDGHRRHVWGYNYQTLEGHLERGQIDFTVIKDSETGAVTFVIHAFSQTARIRNPIIRLGFKLFGRRLQVKFARRSLERMQEFVRAALAREAPAAEPQRGVRPATSSSSAERAMDDVEEQVQGPQAEAQRAK